MRRVQRGASLIESLMSVLIFSAGALAMLGMQAMALGNALETRQRAEAGLLAQEAVARIWAARGPDAGRVPAFDSRQPGAAELNEWRARVAARLPGATLTGPMAPEIRVNTLRPGLHEVAVTLVWRAGGSHGTERRHRSIAYIGAH